MEIKSILHGSWEAKDYGWERLPQCLMLMEIVNDRSELLRGTCVRSTRPTWGIQELVNTQVLSGFPAPVVPCGMRCSSRAQEASKSHKSFGAWSSPDKYKSMHSADASLPFQRMLRRP